MAVKKGGLGRGLSALLSGAEEEYEGAYGETESGEKTEAGNTPVEISLSLIDPNVNQPRKTFDEAAMNELANSIRIHGVISPIILVPNGNRYMIIAGERRYRAAKKAGLMSIPGIVRNYTQQQVKEISLIENLQREDLNPIETANAIKQLMEEYKYTQEEVADRIGKSRPAIANTLRLLTLSQAVIDLVAEGRLSPGHARCLVVVENPEAQLKLAQNGIDNKVSVREFEKMVKAFLTPKQEKPKQEQSIELKDLIGRMQRTFATKVSALGNDRRGRIYIDYYNRDDLDRIVELIERLEKDKAQD
ncbi:ParB/RepB/Spo0J family partition protein [Pumilibacter intestinalis]|jgi:ParB family chromosome partitioning protein|uniref:ParB/RepB/Spo0J family partition protein n=1 Tax=Pumilibacter intestinalis TaxID=2941511 RepID=UPI0020423399|nr:ParB/RepB/Spo0J family partition protein [Pumilibacter intestinalis]MCI8487096.1 ParB/RepB/Spo0J family partition protein [Clostridia bacterium]